MMRSKLSAKTWSIAFVLIIFLGSLFIVSINYYLDPFGLRSVENKNFVNLRASYSYLYPIKIAQKAPYYLVGSSRTRQLSLPLLAHYLDKHIIWIGMPGQSLEESLTLIKALKVNGSHFVSGFDAFAITTARINSNYLQNAFASHNSIIGFLFNLYTIQASFRALTDKFLSHPNDSIFTQENLQTIAKKHPKELEYFHFIRRDPAYKDAIFSLYDINESQILEFAKLGDSQDIIIIFPKHAYYYKLFEKYGVQEKYFHAIKLLVNNTKARVYSFYGINSITRDKANFDDFDSSHFKPKIGNLILAKIFQDESVEIPKGFGVELTKENVEAYLQNLRDSIQTTEIDY